MPPDSAATRLEPAQRRPSSSAGAAAHESAFRHETLFYADGNHGFLDGTLELVERALAREAGVLVAVGPERAAALREALGASAERVCFADMRLLGRNPARIIPVWQDFVREHAFDGHGDAVGIGEPVWPGRSAAELAECERHEALLNLAFDDGPGWHLLCPYDLDGLTDEVIDAARHTHPLHAWDGERQAEDGHTYANEPAQPFAGDLPDPRSPVSELAFTRQNLPQLRHAIAAWATEQALAVESTEELVLAVDELAANSIRHGGGAGTLRYWREDRLLMCEVRDAGWIHAPLVGRSRPAAEARNGRGVWLANQLCDLVQIRSTQAGSVVRVHKCLA
jgi:anti-sigma regulatory factor (Ser/Thr protein kinase)